MQWILPPKIKILEALGCIGDKRIEVNGNKAKVFSSSRGKYYDVEFNQTKNQIMSNDNASFYVGYLGYPSIAYLLATNIISYNPTFATALGDIKWKDINTTFKNDFDKTQEYVLGITQQRGYSNDALLKEVDDIFEKIRKMNLGYLGEKKTPPKGY